MFFKNLFSKLKARANLLNILDKIREVDITHTETAAVVGCEGDLHLELIKLNKSWSF